MAWRVHYRMGIYEEELFYGALVGIGTVSHGCLLYVCAKYYGPFLVESVDAGPQRRCGRSSRSAPLLR